MANISMYKSIIGTQIVGLTDPEYTELRNFIIRLIKDQDQKRRLK